MITLGVLAILRHAQDKSFAAVRRTKSLPQSRELFSSSDHERNP